MKLKGRISILFNHNGLNIEVEDDESNVQFLVVKLNQEQTLKAMSRLSCTPCEIELKGLDKLGKQFETKTIPVSVIDAPDHYKDEESFFGYVQASIDKHYPNQNWQLIHRNINYEARELISKKNMFNAPCRRWVDKIDNNE